MENRSFYNEILTEHNIHPEFKHDLPDANIELEGVNPSCGDDITLKLKVDGDVITDGAFVGDGCADFAGLGGHHAGHDCRAEEGRGAALRRDLFRKMIQRRSDGGGDRRAGGGRRRCRTLRTCPRA